LRKEGVREGDLMPKVVEYLNSPSLKYLPFNRIHAMLVAALAKQVAVLGGKEDRSGYDEPHFNGVDIAALL
jgi:hypothetical protein